MLQFKVDYIFHKTNQTPKWIKNEGKSDKASNELIFRNKIQNFLEVLHSIIVKRKVMIGRHHKGQVKDSSILYQVHYTQEIH